MTLQQSFDLHKNINEMNRQKLNTLKTYCIVKFLLKNQGNQMFLISEFKTVYLVLTLQSIFNRKFYILPNSFWLFI